MSLPYCARCRRPVERIDRVPDPCSEHIIFRAHCHGEVEETRMPAELLLVGGVEVTPAVAFVAHLPEVAP